MNLYQLPTFDDSLADAAKLAAVRQVVEQAVGFAENQLDKIRDAIASPTLAGGLAHAERKYAMGIWIDAGDSVLSEREERDIARAEGLASALELIHAELVA